MPYFRTVYVGRLFDLDGNAYGDLAAADPDGTLAANSDEVIPTQKAVKTYVDAQIASLGLAAPADGDVMIYDAIAGKFVASDDHPTLEVVTAPKE
jgi:hypothetical protein